MIDSSTILESKILVVDDELANVQLIEGMLQRAGYLHVTSTTDPTLVHDLHRDNNFDLIFLDLLMPKENGFEVMEELKKVETDNHLSVLVVTAQPSLKRRAMQAGAKDFVAKPFELSDVLIRTRFMLEVRSLRNQIRQYTPAAGDDSSATGVANPVPHPPK